MRKNAAHFWRAQKLKVFGGARKWNIFDGAESSASVPAANFVRVHAEKLRFSCERLFLPLACGLYNIKNFTHSF